MLILERFNVRMVFKGEGYGLNDVIVHDNETPLVEFYDSRYTKNNTRGQFVSRYSASTLLEGKKGGLNLNGGVPEWTVTAKDMETVRAHVISML